MSLQMMRHERMKPEDVNELLERIEKDLGSIYEACTVDEGVNIAEIIDGMRRRYLQANGSANELAACAAKADRILTLSKRPGAVMRPDVKDACLEMIGTYEERLRVARRKLRILRALKFLLTEVPW